jgi:hypothetical protein
MTTGDAPPPGAHVAIVEERLGWVVAACVESGAFVAVDQPPLADLTARYLETTMLGLSTVCDGAHRIGVPA